MNRFPWAAAIALCVTSFTATTQAASLDEAVAELEAMTWYSEEYPPYNYEVDGEVVGISTDILLAAFEKIGANISRKDIRIIPWNRGYKFIQTRPGTALYSMTYTEERLKSMKFVGPAVPTRVSVIAPKSTQISADTPADLDGLKIGVVRDDVGDQLLLKVLGNDTNVSRKNSLKQLMYLLHSGRIDAVSYSAGVFQHAARKAGDDPGLYEEVFVLEEGQLGYAFHNATDPAILVPLQKAVDELSADGTVERIISTYRD